MQDYRERLVNDICNYIDYLQETFGYRISVHYSVMALGEDFSRFFKYYYHICPLCHEIKCSPQAWRHCIDRQEKIYAALVTQPVLLGTCYAGVSEYIFPIGDMLGNQIGFICFSGYTLSPQDSRQRAYAATAKYNLNKERIEAAINALNPLIPDQSTILCQVAPLQDMFLLLFHLENTHLFQVSCDDPQKSTYLRMIAFTNKEFRDPDYSMKKLAQQMNLSYSYASHIFSKYNKTSFSQYLRQLRIETAKRYLEYTDESITVVGSVSGFSDSNYFSNTFKIETTLSPTQWRKRYFKTL